MNDSKMPQKNGGKQTSSDASGSKQSPIASDLISMPTLALRSAFGGVLMGLANLVPGISGGTMLLAAGIYPAFIEALSSVTRFKFTARALLVLGCVGAAAVGAILLNAGTLKELVVNHRWIMYSLFIGLTLGGVPVVWRLTKRRDITLFLPGLVAFAAMAVLAYLQSQNVSVGGNSGFLMLFCAGIVGASAMILPGLSGGYLLLLMGQYVPILAALHEFKEALKARDLAAAMGPAVSVVLPVGLGVVIGVVLVGNAMKWMMQKFHSQTLGVLLGLLIGSVVGLYPFQEIVEPQVGDTVKGQVVVAETLE